MSGGMHGLLARGKGMHPEVPLLPLGGMHLEADRSTSPKEGSIEVKSWRGNEDKIVNLREKKSNIENLFLKISINSY